VPPGYLMHPLRHFCLHDVPRSAAAGLHLPIIEELLARAVQPEDLARYELDYFQQTREREPELAITHHHLGMVYAELGDYSKAIEHFQVSLRIRPDNKEAKQLLEQLLKTPPRD
jgi:tetratricopeptide (TPR) repeat protein